MQTRFFLFAFSFISFMLVSCKPKEKDRLYVFKSLSESIERKEIEDRKQTDLIIASLVDRTYDPMYRVNAETWLSKAQKIVSLSKDAYNFMGDIKTGILRDAGYTMRTNGKSDYRENDYVAVKKLMIKEGNGIELFKRLRSLNDTMLGLDTLIRKRFETQLGMLPGPFSWDSDPKEFAKEMFDGLPAVEALAILSQLQSNLSDAERRLVLFCHEEGSKNPRHYPQFKEAVPIVTQSSDIVKAGGQLEITAGIGYFQQWGVTSIRIGKNEVPLNSEAYADFKMKVARTAGKYHVPVEMSFEDQDGKQQIVSKMVEYSVVE